MKNKLFFALLSVAALLMATACEKTKSYAEMVKEENEAIARFIEENDFKIVTTRPEKLPYDEKVYYKTPEGLYMHVISAGTSVVDFTSTTPDDNVFVRFKGRRLFKDSEDEINSATIFEFSYNNPYSYYSSVVICQGIIIPLQKEYNLGDEAKVSLIIPSKLGAATEQSLVSPLYYKEITYTVSPQKRP